MLTTFDVVAGVFVLISALLATTRGATREVLSLASWAGAGIFAVWMWQSNPQLARGYIADPTVADIVTIAASFFIALIILHLVTMRIADFVVDSRIGALDRTLGFLFGAARGVLIILIGVIFAQWLMPDILKTYAGDSQSLPRLERMADDLIGAMPDNVEDTINDFLQRGAAGTEAEILPDINGGTDQLEIDPLAPLPEAGASPESEPETSAI
ncbi:MAG: CvpA family protein [Alphaproteobacteria bacterium]|nr:CvpA family protein [Alphaproteobacteria bacterium]